MLFADSLESTKNYVDESKFATRARSLSLFRITEEISV